MAEQSQNRDLVSRVELLESMVGRPLDPPASSLSIQIHEAVRSLEGVRKTMESLNVRVENLQTSMDGVPNLIDGCIQDGLSDYTDTLQGRIEGFKTDLEILKRAVGNGGAGTGEDRPSSSKVRVPEPKPFGGATSAKELENFLWDMETYFQAAKIPKDEKVSITSMYLAGDAKLWWRTRLSDDASANREKIETWVALKKELKENFMPCNTSWLARESLRKLKHKGSVRDYVKEFSSLLLDVRDMSDEDKLFNFLAGLQPWAQAELRRLGVKDLPSAIAGADRLVDFKTIGESDKKGKDGESKGKTGKMGKDGKSGKKNKFKGKKSGGSNSVTTKSGVQLVVNKENKGCYLCGGDHRMKECPKRTKLNALIAESDNDTETGDPPRVNPLQLLSAIHSEKSVGQKGLMYVKTLINGKEVQAMGGHGRHSQLRCRAGNSDTEVEFVAAFQSY